MKRLLAICIPLAFLTVTLIAQHQDADELNSPDYNENGKADEEIFTGRIGLGFFNWNLDFANVQKIESSVDPFLLQRAEVKFTNLYGFETGLNYFSKSLIEFSGFGKEETVSSKKEELARSIAFQVNKNFNNEWTAATTARFMVFTGKITFPRDGISYHNYQGVSQIYNKGETLSWQTTMKDIELKYIQGKNRGSYTGIGIRWFQFRSPQEFKIADEKKVLMTDFQIFNLVFEKNLAFDMSRRTWVEINLPLMIGTNYSQNGLFDATPNITTASFASFSSVSINYGSRRLSIRFTGELTTIATVIMGSSTLKRDLYLSVNEDGLPTEKVSQGPVIRYAATRIEAFWGAFFFRNLENVIS